MEISLKEQERHPVITLNVIDGTKEEDRNKEMRCQTATRLSTPGGARKTSVHPLAMGFADDPSAMIQWSRVTDATQIDPAHMDFVRKVKNVEFLRYMLNDITLLMLLVYFIISWSAVIPHYADRARYESYHKFPVSALDDEFEPSPETSFQDIIDADNACGWIEHMLGVVIPTECIGDVIARDIRGNQSDEYYNVSPNFWEMTMSEQKNRVDTLVVRYQVSNYMGDEPVLQTELVDTSYEYEYEGLTDFIYTPDSGAGTIIGRSGRDYDSHGEIVEYNLPTIRECMARPRKPRQVETECQKDNHFCPTVKRNWTRDICSIFENEHMRVTTIDFTELVYNGEHLADKCIFKDTFGGGEYEYEVNEDSCNPYDLSFYTQYNHWRLVLERDRWGSMSSAAYGYSWRLSADEEYRALMIASGFCVMAVALSLFLKTSFLTWLEYNRRALTRHENPPTAAEAKKLSKSTGPGFFAEIVGMFCMSLYKELLQDLFYWAICWSMIASMYTWFKAVKLRHDFETDCVQCEGETGGGASGCGEGNYIEIVRNGTGLDVGLSQLTMSYGCVYDSYTMQKQFADFEICLAVCVPLVITYVADTLMHLFRCNDSLRRARIATLLSVQKTFIYAIYLVIVIIVVGLAVTIALGQTIETFSVWEISLPSTLLLAVGEVDIEIYDNTRFWQFGSFCTPVISFVFAAILITIFVAVVDDAYTEAEVIMLKEKPRRIPFTGYSTVAPGKCRRPFSICCSDCSDSKVNKSINKEKRDLTVAVVKLQSAFRGKRARKHEVTSWSEKRVSHLFKKIAQMELRQGKLVAMLTKMSAQNDMRAS